MSDMEKDMIDETQHKQSAEAQDSNRELVSTVTMTVLQTLQATGQITGEKKENRKRQQEP